MSHSREFPRPWLQTIWLFLTNGSANQNAKRQLFSTRQLDADLYFYILNIYASKLHLSQSKAIYWWTIVFFCFLGFFFLLLIQCFQINGSKRLLCCLYPKILSLAKDKVIKIDLSKWIECFFNTYCSKYFRNVIKGFILEFYERYFFYIGSQWTQIIFWKYDF